MELNCSFRDIVGGECGLRRTDIEKRRFAKSSGEPTIVPLLSCGKDIKAHKSMYSFTDPSEEIDLILCRSGVFRKPNNLQSWTPSLQPWSRLDKGLTHLVNMSSFKLNCSDYTVIKLKH